MIRLDIPASQKTVIEKASDMAGMDISSFIMKNAYANALSMVNAHTPNHTQAKAELPQAFVQDAVTAHKDYEQTGLHTTHTEMKAWLQTLKANKNAKMPRCHQ